jgi:hypothetical protein
MNQRKGPANVSDTEYLAIMMVSEESSEFQEGQPDGRDSRRLEISRGTHRTI